MAWSNMPPAVGQDIQYWPWLIQFWRALEERARCSNDNPRPRHFSRFANEWDSGEITAASTTTITIGGKAWVTTPKRWVAYATAGYPPDYDVCIDRDPTDPRKTIRLEITDHTADTLTFASMAEHVVSANELVANGGVKGAKAYIVTRVSPWWNERSLQGPNDQALVQGTATGGSTTTLVDTTKTWATNEWAGDMVVIEDKGRAFVTSNTATTLTFAALGTGLSVAAGDAYVIIGDSSVYDFGREPDAPWHWHKGATELYTTHDPRGPIGTIVPITAPDGSKRFNVPIPVTSVTDPDVLTDVLDLDIWSGQTDLDDPPDFCYTPRITRAWRFKQARVEEMQSLFIEPVDWSGRKNMESWNLAWFMDYCGINTVTGTLQDYDSKNAWTPIGTGDILGADEKLVAYAIIVDHAVLPHVSGDENVGTAVLTSGGKLKNTIFGNGTEHTGKSIIIWKGWTRKVPRRVQYFYPACAFVPGEVGGFLVDPPTDGSGEVGSWVRLGISTRYMEQDSRGVTTTTSDSHEAFVNGELARYVGDNWCDPTLGEAGTDDTFPYRNNLYRGAEYPGYTFGDSGTATGGGTYYLEDTSKNWWPNGTLVTHTGTLTTGGTSPVDSGQSGDYFWTTQNDPGHATPGNRGRFFDFILELTSGTYENARIPITAHTPGTPPDPGVLTIQSVGISPSVGNTYRIREPKYKLNRWQGRTVRLTKPDGTTVDATITHSDDTRIYFAELAGAATVAAGWSYRIIEHPTGTVWKRSGGAWVTPDGIAEGNYSRQQAIEPTIVTRYGRVQKADYVSPEQLDEMYVAEDAMRHRLFTAAWNTAEDNRHETLHGVSDVDYTTALDTNADRWLDIGEFGFPDDLTNSSAQAPVAGSTASKNGSDEVIVKSLRAFNRAEYLVPYVLWDNTTYSLKCDFYNFAEKYFAGASEGSTWGDHDQLVGENVWTRHDTNVSSPTDGSMTVSIYIGGKDNGGSLTDITSEEANPTDAAPAGEPSTSNQKGRGFQCAGNPRIIVKYDQGFLTYV